MVVLEKAKAARTSPSRHEESSCIHAHTHAHIHAYMHACKREWEWGGIEMGDRERRQNSEVSESPRRAKIEKTRTMVSFFTERAEAAQEEANKAEAGEKLADRLYKAKEKRWDAKKNHRGKRKLVRPGTYGRLQDLCGHHRLAECTTQRRSCETRCCGG